MIEQPSNYEDSSEDLLRRALLDGDSAAAVAMRVDGLAMCEELTIIFHGRRDLSTIQTYVAHGGRGAGSAVGAAELLRVPCDLDLADAEDRADAEHLYLQQAQALRDALLAADTVLAVWAEPLAEAAGSKVAVNRSIQIDVQLPAHRLMPVCLVAPDRQLMVAPVCGARTLAEGRPPLGIACAQQDVAAVYPLPDDPARCLEDFLERAAIHAHRLADRLTHQEASVQRFLELSDE
jgi:hypothetical protein